MNRSMSHMMLLYDNDAGFLEETVKAARAIDPPIRLHTKELILDPMGQTFIVRINVGVQFIIWVHRYRSFLNREDQ